MDRKQLKQIVYSAIATAGFLVDKMKVKEVGNNAGTWVEKFLKSCGLAKGNPWCACMVNYCLDEAGYPKGLMGNRQYRPSFSRGRVKEWWKWALNEDRDITIEDVEKGDLFLWVNANGTGHTGWVVSAYKVLGVWFIKTIEGNTDADGSREGDGMYRKTRRVTSKIRFVRLW